MENERAVDAIKKASTAIANATVTNEDWADAEFLWISARGLATCQDLSKRCDSMVWYCRVMGNAGGDDAREGMQKRIGMHQGR